MLEFAAAQRRLGQSIIDRLANARASIGDTAPVMLSCIFSRTPSQAAIGGGVMRTRDVTLRVLTGLLTVDVAEGTPVSVYEGEQLGTPAGSYRVAPGGVVVDHKTGLTLLELENA